ncbi:MULTISPECIES: geranylgeranylglycerol-phosphate geranylgeranyltransferase [unclassified Haladaptatus]|uniref:geranylgeranylglycerol-phosphate geranylgeranyltransferase n=1 Tax=unclassified Haladaptatus TaxID=2622732 RepID=UPI00209BD80E|nr:MULTISPECIES: geranylgeranylglycerol-phosphate geranylgeranyltransferase [unclassified Haladaptatus]MCO8245938.1 geranylgeranylglycerol-phosphate geranylgeranyltransferase [Haladaptatus sp. AB643]MCO8254442.1 geranylgeranylglycerol-phosphate geranylgeranyltransferase [Haladaptatus sp. AB618]
MSTDGRAKGLFELTRPGNTFAAGMLTFIGAFVAGGVFTDSQPVQVVAAVVATWLATGAGNAINDYFDRDIDRINAPDRPIPRGAVSPKGTLLFSIVLFVGAVAAALLLPVFAIAIAALNLVALVAYTKLFKGLPGVGNAVVAYLGGSTFLFGSAAVAADAGSTAIPVDGIRTAAILFLLAALSTFTREIIKDVEDMDGDREEGLNTLPLAIGARPATIFGTILLVVAVLASPLPYLWGVFGLPYLAVVLPADAVMLYAAAESFGDPTAGQNHLKYGMFLAAVAFVVGRIAVLF